MVRPRLLMNYIGKIIIIVGIAMLTSVICALYYGENIVWKLLFISVLTILLGMFLSFMFRHDENLNYREGFAIVTLSWIIVSIFWVTALCCQSRLCSLICRCFI